MSNDACAETGPRGKLIVISGPSGAGKTSISTALLEQLPGTVWSVSVTTRPMRRGEQGGRNYEFVGLDEFRERRDAGAFLESAQYIDHWYGTPRKPVEEALAAGRNVVLEIDVQGAMQVAQSMPDSVRIFVLPPNDDALRKRLENRKTENESQRADRLARAREEIDAARQGGCYQHIVVNDALDDAIREIKEIVHKAIEKTEARRTK